MKNKTIELFSFISIIFLLILIINSSIKVAYGVLSISDYSMYLYINGGIGLLLYIASKIRNFKFNKYEIIVLVMALLSCLSLANAIDINIAIFGQVERNEGLLVWLSYYVFLLNAMNIKNKGYLYAIVSLIAIYMLINLFYGLFQVSILPIPSSILITKVSYYASGFLGNSNFFGSLSTILYGLTLGIFIKTGWSLKKVLLILLLLIANFGVIISGAMSAIVAVLAINVVCLIQSIVGIIKKREKRFVYLISLIIGVASFVLVFFVYNVSHSRIKSDVLRMINETTATISEGKMEDNYGSSRIYIWRKSLEKLRVAPITGYGIDNFSNAFDNKFISQTTKKKVDKAHNDYLQRALCEGIISSIVFIVFLLIIFFKGVFKNLAPVYYGLFLAFTAYSVQAFFNISVTRVAPVYFIVIGLLISTLIEKRKGKESIT